MTENTLWPLNWNNLHALGYKTDGESHALTYGNWGGKNYSGGDYDTKLTEPFPFAKDPTTGEYDLTKPIPGFLPAPPLLPPVDKLDYAAMLHDYSYQIAEDNYKKQMNELNGKYPEASKNYETDPALYPQYGLELSNIANQRDKTINDADATLMRGALVSGNELSADGKVYAGLLLSLFMAKYGAGDVLLNLKKINDDHQSLKESAHKIKDLGRTTNTDPMVLDLDRDGIISTLSTDKGIHFDLENTGLAPTTGWIAPTEGILVWDKNGDGKIISGDQLFGDKTTLNDGSFASIGFDALASLDIDSKGYIDKTNPYWSQIKIWQDINSDGKCDPSELKTLDEWGIISISLDYENIFIIDENGNIAVQRGHFTWADGTTSIIQDMLLVEDWIDSELREDQILDIPQDIADLPNILGIGKMLDLHQAMVRDPELTKLVKDFINKSMASDINTLQNLFKDIITQWSGIPKDDGTVRSGPYPTSAFSMNFLEVIWGDKYQQFNGVWHDDPRGSMQPIVVDLYNKIFGTLYSELLGKSLTSILSEYITIDVEITTSNEFNFLVNFNGILDLIAQVETSSQKKQLDIFIKLYNGLKSINLLKEFEETEVFNILRKQYELFDTAFKEYNIVSNTTNTSINGSFEADYFIITKNITTVTHNGGADIYLIQKDVSKLTINTTTNTAKDDLGGTIIFEGRNMADATIARYGNDVIIKFSDGAIFTIKGFSENGHINPASPMNDIVFGDGGTIHKDNLIAIDVYIASDSGTIYGINNSTETLHAGDFGGTMYGGKHGHYTLAGGKGDLTYYAGIDSETVFILGSGKNTIYCSDGKNQIIAGKDIGNTVISMQSSAMVDQFSTLTSIRFEDNLTASDLSYSIKGTSLIITINETGHTITINGFITTKNMIATHVLDNIEFMDGSKLEIKDLSSLPIYQTDNSTVYGLDNANEQHIYSNTYGDIKTGNHGSYIVHGSNNTSTSSQSITGGADSKITYIVGAGKATYTSGDYQNIYIIGKNVGNTTINGNNSTRYPDAFTKIVFEEGISAKDITVVRNGNNLEISIDGNPNKIIINNFISGQTAKLHALDSIEFSDGTALTLDDFISLPIYQNGPGYVYGIDGAQEQHIYSNTNAPIEGGSNGSYIIHTLNEPMATQQTVFGGANSLTTFIVGSTPTSINAGNYQNIYLFGNDFGKTVISPSSTIKSSEAFSKIVFDESVKPENVHIIRNSTTLEITIDGNPNKIIVNGYFSSTHSTGNVRGLDSIEFSDGTALTLDDFISLPIYQNGPGYVYGIDGAQEQHIYSNTNAPIEGGSNGSYIIHTLNEPMATQQTVFGGANSLTTFIVGSTPTSINAGNYQNIYLFGNDFGKTVISPSSTIKSSEAFSKIVFDESVKPENVHIIRNSTTLEITIDGNPNKIIVNGYFSSTHSTGNVRGLDSIEFSDGTALTLDDFISGDIFGIPGYTTYGVNGAHEQHIYSNSAPTYAGDNGTYIIHGSNDPKVISQTIIGGNNSVQTFIVGTSNALYTNGNYQNTYIVNGKFGNTTIAASSSIKSADAFTKIVFDESVKPENVHIIRNSTTLEITIDGNPNKIIVNGYFSSTHSTGNVRGLDSIEFSDGTALTLDDFISGDIFGIPGYTTYGVNGAHEQHIYSNSAPTYAGDNGTYIIHGSNDPKVISQTIIGGNNSVQTFIVGTSNALYTNGNYQNTYIVNGKFGNTTIAASSSIKSADAFTKIVFDESVKPENIHIIRNSTTLEITIDGNPNKIIVNGYFSSTHSTGNVRGLDSIEFSDGTALTLDDFISGDIFGIPGYTTYGVNGAHEQHIYSNSAPTYAGDNGTYIIHGSNDPKVISQTIIGGNNSVQTFIVGTSNALYTNGNYQNTYIVNGKFGNTTIAASSSIKSADAFTKIVFDESVKPENVHIIRNSTTLEITIDGNPNKIIVNNFCNSNGTLINNRGIDSIEFSNGKTFTIEDICSASNIIYVNYETKHIDYIINESSQTIELTTDQHKFFIGDIFGNTTINSTSSKYGVSNEIIFDNGVSKEDISLERVGNSLIIKLVGNDNTITFNNFFSGNTVSPYHTLETIRFSDGSLLNISDLSTADIYVDKNSSNVSNIQITNNYHGNVVTGDLESTISSPTTGEVNLTIGVAKTIYNISNGTSATTINYSLNSGDLIVNSLCTSFGQTNKLLFGEGVSPSDISYFRSGDSLIIKIANSEHSITFNNYYSGATLSSYHSLDKIQFSTGEEIKLEALTSADMDLSGYRINLDKIYMTENYHGKILVGDNDTNIISSKTGHVDFYSGYGNTTYNIVSASTLSTNFYIRPDFGNLVINSNSTNFGFTNELIFDSKISSSDVTYFRSGDNLVIKVTGNDHSITFNNYFSGNTLSGNHSLDLIKFSDGSQINLDQLASANMYIDSYTANLDKIFINGNHNINIYGGEKSSTINTAETGHVDYYLGTGKTTYNIITKSTTSTTFHVKIDFGDMVVNSASTNFGFTNEIIFEDNIKPSNVHTTRSGDNLIIKVDGNDNSITITNYFSGSGYSNYHSLDLIKFTDGTTIKSNDLISSDMIIDSYTTNLNAIYITENYHGTIYGGSKDFTMNSCQTGHVEYMVGTGKAVYNIVASSTTSTTLHIGSNFGDLIVNSSTTNFGFTNELVFDSSVSISDVTYQRAGNNLVVKVAGNEHSITFTNYFSNGSLSTYHSLDQITFNDGTKISIKDLASADMVIDNYQTNLNSIYIADGYHGNVYGGEKEATINSSNYGHVEFFAGLGKTTYNVVSGATTSTTFHVGNSFGDLIINTSSSNFGFTNELVFDSTVSISDVSYLRVGNALVIKVAGNEHSITFNAYFSNSSLSTYHSLDQITFSDGTKISIKDLASADMVIDNYQTSLNSIYIADGYHGNVYAGEKEATVNSSNYGHVEFYTGIGKTTYNIVFNSTASTTFHIGNTFGDLIINSSSSNFGFTNELVFDSSVSISDVSYQRVGNNLVIKVAGNDHSITFSNYFSNSGLSTYHGIDVIKFSDGDFLYSKQFLNAEVHADKSNVMYTSKQFHGDVFGADDHDINVYISDDSIVNYYAGKSTATISLGGGESNIIFGKDSGSVTILSYNYDFSLVNKVIFDSSISKNDVSYFRSGTDLIISILGAESKITIKAFFNSTFSGFGSYHTIDAIEFMDGSKITKSTMLTAKELMKSVFFSEDFGEETIVISDDDLLDNIGIENDSDDEDEENDNTEEIVEVVITEEDFIALEENGYNFLISNSHGNVDIENGDLIFNSEVTSGNLWMKNVDGDLIINVLGTDEEIVVQNWFNGEHSIEKILTADGVEISSDQIENFVEQMSQFSKPEDQSQIPPQINQMWESL